MWEIAVYLAVAGDAMMVSFCAVLLTRDVLDEILDYIESVSGGFLPTVSLIGGPSDTLIKNISACKFYIFTYFLF